MWAKTGISKKWEETWFFATFLFLQLLPIFHNAGFLLRNQPKGYDYYDNLQSNTLLLYLDTLRLKYSLWDVAFSGTTRVHPCTFYQYPFFFISGQQINLDLPLIRNCGAFCNKIWQVSRFLVLAQERSDFTVNLIDDVTTLPDLQTEDRWILSRCAGTVRDVNRHLEDRDFHLAARALRKFLYANLCDVYVVSRRD